MPAPLARTEFHNGPVAHSDTRHLGLTLLLGLAVAGDFANFYITLSLVANEYPVITLLVVLALTAASVALAHSAGVVLRLSGGSPSRGRTVVLSAMGGSWLVLGVAAAVVRWFAPAAPAGESARPRFGQTGATVAAEATQTHHLTSLLLLGLYLASGVLAAWIAYLDHGTRWWPAWWARRRLSRARVRDQVRHEQARRAEAEVLRRRCELTAVRAQHEAALHRHDALVDELRAYSRLLIATSMGDPEATKRLTARPVAEHTP